MSGRTIDALIVDPFVSCHAVKENDNGAIDKVAKTFASIADRTDAAVELIHHARKTNGAEVTVEDGRGAVALLAASRSARVLNVMTKDEGKSAGVGNHRSYFRADDGKPNLAPPADKASWFRFVSIALGNGDNVGVVEPWQIPRRLRRGDREQPARSPGSRFQRAMAGKLASNRLGRHPDRQRTRPRPNQRGAQSQDQEAAQDMDRERHVRRRRAGRHEPQAPLRQGREAGERLIVSTFARWVEKGGEVVAQISSTTTPLLGVEVVVETAEAEVVKWRRRRRGR